MSNSITPVLEMRGIRKLFPGTVALDSADLEVRAGEVHCVLGENGAGKSTLMKILSGSYQPDGGQILIDGAVQTIGSPQDGLAAGISVIYQELDLFPDLTVAQNLFIGHAPSRFGLVRGRSRRAQSLAYLKRVGATFSPDAVVGSLPIADQQLTAIARALTTDARIIVMDEPTATLGEADVANVIRVIRSLVAEGRAVIYISHRLGEIATVGDRITVLRDGRTVARHEVKDTDAQQWIADMIGDKRKELTEVHTSIIATGDPYLEIDHVRVPGLIDISGIEVRKGEIVGVAGLGGAGRTTLLAAVFGSRASHHSIRVNGQPYRARSTRAAVRAGFGLVPESRKTEGLMLGLSVWRNAAISSIGRAPWLMPHSRGRSLSEPIIGRLGVKYSNGNQPIGQLSGGNQQKIVLAKWLTRGSRILLLDEPTRGLDIGAKADLYRQVRLLAENGAVVLVASSELGELVANTHRIVVLHEGRNIGTFDPRLHSEETITHAIISGLVPTSERAS
ncbi:sugar ABC transporter ATP-binding protein [soil metagenome]